MRRAALIAIAIAGCKGGAAGRGSAGSGSAGSSGFTAAADPHPMPGDAGVDANLDSCRAALADIAARPPAERPQALIAACQPCGDWAALLAWNTPATEGGPSHAALEASMQACHGYCNGNARQRFLGVLDTARGQSTRGPWRLLGEVCRAEVSAEPDARFMSAPFFALDRIARALGDGGPALTVPLPPVSVTGVGVELPAAVQPAGAGTGSAPPPPVAIDGDAGTIALTVDAREVLIGQLPSATLSNKGLIVTGDYPGKVVALDQLATQLAARAKTDPRPVLMLVPHALPAARVAEVVAAASKGAATAAALRLAVAAPSPTGWSLPAALPLHLAAAPGHGAVAIAVAPGDKVDDLVAKLTAAMAPGVTTAALVR